MMHDVKEKFKKVYYKYIGKIKQRKFKYKDFTIISNNCFGGIIYRNNAMEYRTPTAGLFFMAFDYIKFIYNIDKYLDTDLKEISIDQSNHKDYLKSINYNAPIGKLEDIEVMFLHYKTFDEAKKKWNRRKERINKDRIIFKFSEQNLCTYEDLKNFYNFKAENKLCFTYNDYPEFNFIRFKNCKSIEKFSDSKERIFKKYIDIYKYVNQIKNKKIKLLTLVANLDKCNGISSYVINYYRKLDLNRFQMDFIVTGNEICDEYKKIIEDNGGHIYMNGAPSIKRFVKDINFIKKFMREHNDYDILHSHLVNLGYFYLKYAKKNKINIRIEHSHTVIPREKNMIRDLRNQLFARLVVKSSNVYFACSKIAGESLFKNKKFYIIKNAIDIKKYIYNDKIREKYRNKLGLQDKIVIGHVGRFDFVKNQDFIIEVFKKLYKKNKKYYLLLIGAGINKENIEKKIKNDKVKNVSLLGVRDDIDKLLQAIDIFVLPSSFEGLGLVAVEAQIADLECLLSTGVPSEVKITDKVKFLSLNQEEWNQEIINTKLKSRKDISKEVIVSNFDINIQSKVLQKIYLSLLEDIGVKYEK